MLQLQSALGIIALLAIAWAISEHRRRVAWRPVTIGLALTVILAFVLIKVPADCARWRMTWTASSTACGSFA